MYITKIKILKDSSRAQLFLDDQPALTAQLTTLARLGLEEGSELDPQALHQIKAEDLVSLALKRLTRFLKVRPRSVFEVRRKLQPLFPQATVVELVARLEKNNLLNDERFAREWLEERLLGQMKSLREIDFELRQLGISKAIRSQLFLNDQPALQQEELEIALHLAQKKAHLAAKLSGRAFFIKIGSYLARKGFPYHVIRQVLSAETFPQLKGPGAG